MSRIRIFILAASGVLSCLLSNIFVSTVPSPAVWHKGGTPSQSGGPCLSQASWSALPSLASVRSNEARRGVNLHSAALRARPLFGPFAETKSLARARPKEVSPAGAKPGNTEHYVETRNKGQVCCGKFRAQVWGNRPQGKASRSRWDRWSQKFVNNRSDPIP